MLAQGCLDLFFDAAPHLGYFFQFFELSTKAAFAKAAFDTLRSSPRVKGKSGAVLSGAEAFFGLNRAYSRGNIYIYI